MLYRSNEAAEKSERFVVSTSAAGQKHKPVSQSKRAQRQKRGSTVFDPEAQTRRELAEVRRGKGAVQSAIPPALRALRQEPPAAVAALLAERLIQPADLLICTDTDINRAGEYQPQ